MAWKTLKLDIGQKHQLDAPNQEFEIRIIPMLWLAGSIGTDVMAELTEMESKVSSLPEGSGEGVKLRMETLYRVIPSFIAGWNLKDEHGADIAWPLVDPSFIRSLPIQIIQNIADEAISYGQRDEDQAPDGTDDPDKEDPTAKSIPFVNAEPSETPSSQDPAQVV